MAVASLVVAEATWVVVAVLKVAGSPEVFLFIPVTLFAGGGAGALAATMALGQIKETGEDGNGTAWIGLLLGYLNLAALAIMFALWVGTIFFLTMQGRKPT
jgi:hypothetical protein